MKRENRIKWAAVIGLVVLVSFTGRMGHKKTFNPQSLENINALATESSEIPDGRLKFCIGDGDLLCPYMDIKVWEIVTITRSK